MTGTQQLFINTAKSQANTLRPPFGQIDWAAICQAWYQCGAWRDMHSMVLEVAKCKGIIRRENELPVYKNWQRVERKSDDFSDKQAIQRNKVRGQLLGVWDRDPEQALQFRGETVWKNMSR